VAISQHCRPHHDIAVAGAATPDAHRRPGRRANRTGGLPEVVDQRLTFAGWRTTPDLRRHEHPHT